VTDYYEIQQLRAQIDDVRELADAYDRDGQDIPTAEIRAILNGAK
jgi:hypothetical protein